MSAFQPSVLHLDGPLRGPTNTGLRRSVRTLLRRGERRIVLDLAHVPAVDAAGLGELVRAFNMATAVDGALRITHTTRHVRECLNRVGLFDLLSQDPDLAVRRAPQPGPQ